MNFFTEPLSGRRQHGLAILWRQSLTKKCNIVDLDDVRFLGMEIVINDNNN